MSENEDFLASRTCLLPPIPEHEIAAKILGDAADAILVGDLKLARDLVWRADMPVLYDHAFLVMNGKDPRIQRKRPLRIPTVKVAKIAARMPSSEATKALFARDGWRCRFCSCRVFSPKARNAMRAALPGAIRWSEAEGFHGAFYAMMASVDHVVPYSVGGTNEDENLVTACWSCQFGRSELLLEAVGLLDPRARPPVKDSWDGLERLLPRSALSPAVVRTKRRPSPLLSPSLPSKISTTALPATVSRSALIQGVRAHAVKNAGKAGWDILTNEWSDAQIDAIMGIRTKSVLGAVQMISIFGGLRALAEQRQAETVETMTETNEAA